MIRYLTTPDLDEVAELISLAGGVKWSAAQLAKVIARDQLVVWVEVEGDVINGVAIVELGRRELTLNELCVHPDVRRRGVGRRLIEHVARKVERTRRQRLTASIAATNLAGQAFLQACCFRFVRRLPGECFDLAAQSHVDGLTFERPVMDAGAVVIEKIMAGEL